MVNLEELMEENGTGGGGEANDMEVRARETCIMAESLEAIIEGIEEGLHR